MDDVPGLLCIFGGEVSEVRKRDSLSLCIGTLGDFFTSASFNGCEGINTGDFSEPDPLGFADFLETWFLVSPSARDFAWKGVEGADSEKSVTGSRFKMVGPGDAVVNEATVEFAAAGATCKLNEGLAGPQGGERPP